jgi:beta-galactosidase GanA
MQITAEDLLGLTAMLRDRASDILKNGGDLVTTARYAALNDTADTISTWARNLQNNSEEAAA